MTKKTGKAWIGLVGCALIACSLMVGSTVGTAQTVSVGSGSLAVGDTIEIPIILDRAPQGLSGYILTVALTDPAVAGIEGVEFVAFSGASRAEISPDGGSVEIRAADLGAAVGPGDVDITLARITFRGRAEGSSPITLQISTFDADDGTDLSHSTAAQGGSLTVLAAPSSSPTLRLGSADVTVGNTAQIPLVLDRAPQGLSGYILTVALTDPAVAGIEGVEFVAFSGASRAEISPDGGSVEIRAADLGAAVGPGDVDITLARITFRGRAEGSSPITLQLDRLDADDGTDLLASTNIANGTITVTTGISDTTPPQFSNPQPSPGSTVGTDRPTISIEIRDDNGVDPGSIRIGVTDSLGTEHTFVTHANGGRGRDRGRGMTPLLILSPYGYDHGFRLWTSPSNLLLLPAGGFINLSVKATVDLRAAGIHLAAGPVTVTVSAKDKAGNEGSTSWSFTVSGGDGGGGDITPPRFSDERPAPGSTVHESRPVISIAITDPDSGVDRSSIELRVENNGMGNTFTLSSPGARFDAGAGVFSVDLEAAGIALAAGPVTVEVSASDNAGNPGSASWSFSVELPTTTMEPGDVNGDGVVDGKDVDLVSKFVFTGQGLDPAQRQAANVARPCGPPDDRSTINFSDITHLTQAAVGIRTEFECFPGVAVNSSVPSGAEEPLRVAKIAAYPNPAMGMGMDGRVHITFAVEGEGIAGVRAEVFDLAGRRVFDSGLLPGAELVWPLTDGSGKAEATANGVYFYVVTVYGYYGEFLRGEVRKLVVLG